ncbi:glycoside hydrolase [Arthrobacter phage Gorpy]|nr:glycoside hydrolase [Arthrobacter phage Gorpy]
MAYMKDSAGRRLDSFPAKAPATPTAPASPVVGQEWLSSAMADLRVSPNPVDRKVITTVGGADGDANQEACVWTDATKFNMLYTAGNGLWYQSCPLTSDPTVLANWTKNTAGTVIGSGNGVAQINHASVYDPNPGQTTGLVYCFGNDQTGKTIKVYTASKSAPTVWTMVGQSHAIADMPAGAMNFGNTYVVQDLDGTYVMFIEFQDSATRWQLAQSRSSSLTGAFTRLTGTMTSLYPTAKWSMAGGAWVVRENGQWVMVYHAGYGAFGNLPTEIFRATAPTLGSDNWTVLDGGKQFIRRAGKYEIDQTADFEAVRAPNGQVYAFWTGLDNRVPMRARVVVSPLMPTRKRWDGSVWQPLDRPVQPTEGTQQPTRPVMTAMTADFSGTATAWTDVPGLSVVWNPTGTDFEAALHGVFAPSGDSTTRYQFRIQATAEVSGSPTTVNVNMGAIAGTNGAPVNVSMNARVARARVNVDIPIKVQYQVTSGATLNCRPVAQAGFEFATLKCTDLAYQPTITLP